MNDAPPPPAASPEDNALTRLERRLARLEQHLGLPPLDAPLPVDTTVAPAPVAATMPAAAPEDLESVVGQNWFAGVGIVVLTCGVGFTLSLPFPSLPAFLPALVGYALSGALFFAGKAGRHAIAPVSRGLTGAAMALLYFATLRLFVFGATPVLALDSTFGRLLLVAAVAANLAFAWRQSSHVLLGFALLTGYFTSALLDSPGWLFPLLAAWAVVAVLAAHRRQVPVLVLVLTIPGSYLSYLWWMMGSPWSGRPLHLVTAPAGALYALVALWVIVAAAPLFRRDRPGEDQVDILTAVFNCAVGFGLFLLHSVLAFQAELVTAQLVAAVVLLGLAAAFWRRGESPVAVFFYAMTGYLALTAAILRAFPAPDVFVWLSLQSLLVVATALWFRSRFIVMANFPIFVLVVLGYVITASRETGISVGFGIVALLTARILNWQQERLTLKTQFMRNAYLACAFLVFPYAFYHLVPRALVSVAWVGIALAYYVMNLVVRNVKYRWMGHLTLLLTVLYIVVIGLTQLAPAYRIASFLLLGTVLLVVSLLFSRLRGRRRTGGDPSPAS